MSLTQEEEIWGAARRAATLALHDSAPVVSPKREFPSGGQIIMRDGEIKYLEILGTRNVAKTLPFTKNTVVNLRSVTKNITGFIAAKLVEEGRMSYDDVMESFPTIRDYVKNVAPDPAFQGAGVIPVRTDLTVRHFLCHCGGVNFASDMDSKIGAGTSSLSDLATFFAKSTGTISDHDPTWPQVYNDKADAFVAIACEDAARETGRVPYKYTDMVNEMFATLGMTRSYNGLRFDDRSNATDYTVVLDVVGDSSFDIAQAMVYDSGPTFDVIEEITKQGGVDNPAVHYDSARLHGYASAYSTLSDLGKMADRIWRPGVYFQNQATIDNQFDYAQAGGYFGGGSQLNDGINQAGAGPNAGRNNYVAPPWRGSTLGHYIYRLVSDSQGGTHLAYGGQGGGGAGGAGATWICVPSLGISGAGVKCNSGSALESDILLAVADYCANFG